MDNVFRRIEDLEKLVGNTPLVEIRYRYKGISGSVYAKGEYFNLTGSVKDRMALYVLKKALERGELKEGDVISEATSGNTGISFCAMGSYLGHKVVIYMPDWMSEERKKMMTSLGATIRPVSAEEGGFLGSIALSKGHVNPEGGVFLPLQFENEDNVEGQYLSLGLELVKQLKDLGLSPDGFVAGVGTGGTVMGVKRAFREANPKAVICPLEPAESPVLTEKKHVGHHRIAGISDEFVPPVCKLEELDHIVTISDSDAILAAKALAKNGLAVGISSGANLLGAILLKEELGEGACVSTVFADDNKKYLSTDLLKEEPMKEGSMMKDLEILGFRSYR